MRVYLLGERADAQRLASTQQTAQAPLLRLPMLYEEAQPAEPMLSELKRELMPATPAREKARHKPEAALVPELALEPELMELAPVLPWKPVNR